MSDIAPGYVVPRADVESYIVEAAKARGIDPGTALTVYRHEGAGAWQSSVVKNGARERSYGPFQLYIDGGLGNKFQRTTGLDPRDPQTWKHNIDFALTEAQRGGWGPWYGAKAAGITGYMGIDGRAGPAPTRVARGGGSTASERSPSALDMDSVPGLGLSRGLSRAGIVQQVGSLFPAPGLGQPLKLKNVPVNAHEHIDMTPEEYANWREQQT